jgi:hypothetical protein
MPDHDPLMKRVLGVPAHAAQLIASVLPPELGVVLDLSALEPLPTESVDDELTRRIADSRFRVPFKAPYDGYGFVQVIAEHASTPIPHLVLRVLEYEVRAWVEILRERGGDAGDGVLPPVICVVISHHRDGWRASRSFHDLMPALRAVPALRRYVPNFELVVDDLSLLSDANLRARKLDPFPRLALWMLRHSSDFAAIEASLAEFADDFGMLLDTRPEDLRSLLRYLVGISPGIPEADLHRLVGRVIPRMEEYMVSTADLIRAEGEALGIAKGEALGIAKGEALGKAEAVLAVLEARALAITEEQRATILACTDLATIDRWLRAAVSCASADALFAH